MEEINNIEREKEDSPKTPTPTHTVRTKHTLILGKELLVEVKDGEEKGK